MAARRVDLGRLLGTTTILPPGQAGLGQTAEQVLGVSLEGADRLLGVVAVASRRPRQFRPVEERLLVALADHAAVALENARLYQELKENVDELRRTEAQLLQTEKIAAMGQLLAGVAHELNNPVSVVIGQARLLKMTSKVEADAQRAAKIAAAAERCGRIMKNFLALARQHPPERQRVDLDDIVREARIRWSASASPSSSMTSSESSAACSAPPPDPGRLPRIG
jgi:signal transduction histidine kinase